MNRRQINRFIDLLPVSSQIIGSPRHVTSLGKYASEQSNCTQKNISKEAATYIEKVPSFFCKSKLVTSFPLAVAGLEQARVWGRNGAVITRNDYFLRDVSYEFNREGHKQHSIFYTVKEKKIVDYKGIGTVISHPGAEIYYHWMMDIIPRLGLVRELQPLENVDHIVCDYSGLPFQKETLQMLGIEGQVLRSNDNWHFHARFNYLIVPSLAGGHDQPNLYQINFLKEMFSGITIGASAHRKIYISRKKSGKRLLEDEDKVIKMLLGVGFEILYCEELSVAAQARLFAEAKCVIGPHGSAFANLVFCQPGTHVIDIFNRSQINPCFWVISELCNLNYHFLPGTSVPADDNYKHDHIRINPDHLEKLVLSLGDLA